jgi:PDZ domain-containing secreted protein
MKKISISLTALLAFTLVSSELYAQEQRKEIELRIEKSGDGEKQTPIENLSPGKIKNEQNVRVIIKKDKGANGAQISINEEPMGKLGNIKLDSNIQTFIIIDDDGTEMRSSQFNLKDIEMEGDIFKQFEGIKEVKTPFLGVLTEKVLEGARVVEITKESAAEKAGLQKEDIITKVGEENITDPANLAEVISSKKPKELVTLYYTRNGKKANVKVTLGERARMEKIITMKSSPKMGKVLAIPNRPGNPIEKMIIIEDGQGDEESNSPNIFYELNSNNQIEYAMPKQKKIGLKIQDLEEGIGVKVIDIEKESASEKAGLQKGDILVSIGGVKVGNTDEARQQLRPIPAKNSYTIKAKRGGKEMNFEVKYPKKINTIDL